jgi:hypothetical protein
MCILCIFSSSGPKNKLRYCHHLCSSSINFCYFNIFLTNYKLLFFVDYNLTVYCWVSQLVGSHFWGGFFFWKAYVCYMVGMLPTWSSAEYVLYWSIGSPRWQYLNLFFGPDELKIHNIHILYPNLKFRNKIILLPHIILIYAICQRSCSLSVTEYYPLYTFQI